MPRSAVPAGADLPVEQWETYSGKLMELTLCKNTSFSCTYSVKKRERGYCGPSIPHPENLKHVRPLGWILPVLLFWFFGTGTGGL